MEDTTHGRLYLHCEECEMGWLQPQESHDPSKGFLTLNEIFESEIPSYDRILKFGWSGYAKHVIEK